MCHSFAWPEYIFGRIMIFLNLSYWAFTYVNVLLKKYTLYIFLNDCGTTFINGKGVAGACAGVDGEDTKSSTTQRV